ncbi:hypothetical protein RclHR1_00660013 [Rhizophagus clarus]|uniref:Uncharacterized protein n=1 Tax=Rhizophagus clarus TaxID=94130 RepID=A0A2Z6SJ95_9GLOM|nr:hypothetical protein RclHR1_00660013 [Rhizophagus clarus]GES73876.1 hypothetical protein GLOIN_2v1875698 [Rhizophagus clarus]
MDEFGLFYQPPNDNNFYHIICKTFILPQNSEDIVSLEDEHDYEFFYQDSNANYHVTCKLLSHTLIMDILNKEIYGVDYDVNELKRKYILHLNQKLNLESNLKGFLPFIQDQIFNSDPRVAEASTISQGNMNINTSVSTQATANQPTQYYWSISQVNELGLFYQPPNDNIFYHVNCKPILHDTQVYDYDYDHEFFHLARYHVTCKSLAHSSIVNILNKEIYGRDFDTADLKREHINLYQKFNLELNLKKDLSFPYF